MKINYLWLICTRARKGLFQIQKTVKKTKKEIKMKQKQNKTKPNEKREKNCLNQSLQNYRLVFKLTDCMAILQTIRDINVKGFIVICANKNKQRG